MYPEARAFAQEALIEAQLSSFVTESDTTRLSSACQSVIQQANELISLLESGDLPELERQYSVLSCSVSELRRLRPVITEEKRQNESEHRLPMELVLQGLQFVEHLSFKVFPRLNRASQQFSVSSPESLGVIDLSRHQLTKLFEPKPRYIGCASVQQSAFCSGRFGTRLTFLP